MPSIRPRNADPMAYLRWLFQKTEQDLIDEILQKRVRGHVDYGQVAALERIQRDLQDMVDQSYEYVPKMIEKRFYGSNKDLSGYANARSIAGRTNMVMMETLTDNLLGEIVEAAAVAANTAEKLYTIARLDNDEFRQAALSNTAYAEALGRGAYATAELMEASLRNHGITAFVDKAGRQWSLTDYCNMATRTTARQAEVAGVLSKDDHDLYQIVKIGTTCPICAVYEGRVYSKSGTNPNYPPLAMAFGKIDPAGGDDLSNTYLNIHPNCLHSLVKFTEMGKTEKQLQRIREFSSPETNPLTHDPRSKKQIQEYRDKERRRAKLLRELRKKEAEKALAKTYARSRNVRSFEDLEKLSQSPVIHMDNYDDISKYFGETHKIKINGFETKDLFKTKAVLAGYDDMFTEFPEMKWVISQIKFDPKLKKYGIMNARKRISKIGPSGLGDFGTGVHEAAHALDLARSPLSGPSYSEQILIQARKNLKLRINSNRYINLGMQITGSKEEMKKPDELFAYALETAKGGVKNELAEEIYRLVKGSNA